LSDKLRVYNDRPYDIGAVLLNGQSVNIKSGSFTLLSEDDIAFIESQCAYNKKLFGTGKLRIDKATEEKIDEIGIVKSEENFHISIDEIEKKLLGGIANLKKWLATIQDKAYLFEIYTIAKSLDLSTSKMKALKDILPELLTADE
jgi:hypothetical protein